MGMKWRRVEGKLCMVLSAFLAATGQLFWAWSKAGWIYLAIGFACYGVGFLFMQRALEKEKLSVAYPLMCVSYAVALLYGYWFLGEAITWNKLAGILVIGIGVVFTTYER